MNTDHMVRELAPIIRAVVVRCTVANIDAPTLAKALSTACPWVNGTITNTLRFGQWGTESGVTVEMAFSGNDSTQWQLAIESLADICAERQEECAYITIASHGTLCPYLLYPPVFLKDGVPVGPYRYRLAEVA